MSNRLLKFQNGHFSIVEQLGKVLSKFLSGYIPQLFSKNRIYEIEANFFAAQLLMPQQILFELIRRGANISVANLTKWFGVSKQAAQKRIETLTKINNDYRTADEIEIDELVSKCYFNQIHFI